MIKTQIQVEEWQFEALKRRAASEHRSMSDFVREALTEALRKPGSVCPLAELAGKYASSGAADLKDHDAGWAETIR